MTMKGFKVFLFILVFFKAFAALNFAKRIPSPG